MAEMVFSTHGDVEEAYRAATDPYVITEPASFILATPEKACNPHIVHMPCGWSEPLGCMNLMTVGMDVIGQLMKDHLTEKHQSELTDILIKVMLRRN